MPTDTVMTSQKLEIAGKWLFGMALVAGIVFSTSGIELLPFILGLVFLTALPGFPGFRHEIRWRRMLLFSVVAMTVLLGAFYWIITRYNDFEQGRFIDFCLWMVWPLGDLAINGALPPVYWLPFWTMDGLLFGFIIESFFALSKQRGLKRIEACVRRNSEEEGDVPPFGLAGILCMASLAVIFLAARLLAGSTHRLYEWLFPIFFISGPLATAFLVLHRSSWQRELPAKRRAVSILLRSCVIVGVVLFVVLLMLLAMAFLASQEVSRGQYGGL